MHILDIIFWSFFAVTVGFIAWTFLRMFVEAIVDRRPAKRAPHRASGLGGGDSSSPSLSGEIESGDAADGESNAGGDSGGSDFSGGGGESGGGGGSGGW